MAIYDGGEAGGHYTWDTFRVTKPASRFEISLIILALVSMGLISAAFVVLRLISGRRRPRH